MTKKGYRLTKEHKQNISDGAKNRPPVTDETKEKLRESHLGKKPSEETREKLREAREFRPPMSEETKQKIRDSVKDRPPVSEETRQKHRDLWQDPEYVRKQMAANHVQPNRMELAAATWLAPLGFAYVGDGQLIISGKCPDFWDGGTRLIELYGDYWHKGQDPQDRINLFKAVGYDCLVIWEHDLRYSEPTVLTRVQDFVTGREL